MGDSHNKSKFTVKLPKQHTKLTTNIKGTIGEYQEIANLTKKGYLVAVSQTGQVTLLDIKTNTYRKHKKSYRRKIWRTPTAKQKKLGIKIVMVDHGNEL